MLVGCDELADFLFSQYDNLAFNVVMLLDRTRLTDDH